MYAGVVLEIGATEGWRCENELADMRAGLWRAGVYKSARHVQLDLTSQKINDEKEEEKAFHTC